ncbi:MAG: lipopolysaccharide biosynthesis protein [Deltaproteobacteria bacterium]|uniref:lipopolysaccharide biosynthesis protein n=1 Tax=Desulfobacula sp. TaxID=2593537 RepID=UPI0019868A00|nr:lipopolysaccharide biosynthesis protein [Candidatus Desulfobacula maris]MBL6992774.1 lipopolysaccharide biosynthesis protein [Desulfobacula sp.]
MSLGKKAFKSGSWYALFTFASQGFSWLITFWVARLLMPDDYGLMALTTIFTGYAAWFSELGLGAAIIQRESPTQEDLSSIFWFTLGVGVLLAIACFPIASISAWFFEEPRLIALTRTIAIIFLINSVQIVPGNLLRKDMEFKKLGFIKMIAIFISCVYMLISAYRGAGVWSLLGGQILLAFVNTLLVVCLVRWYPRRHFDFKEVSSYIKYGVRIAIGRTLFYITDNSDKFIVGKKLGAVDVGYYSFALQLSQLPTEKITVMINQISFPLFSKLQHSKEEFNRHYLKIIKIIATLVLPLFVGGFLVAEELIFVVLGDKWSPIIILFKYLCLAQIITSLSAINNIVHNALGKAELSMYFNGLCAVLMTISFYIAAVYYGLDAMIFPWCGTYFLLCAGWIYFTLYKLGISIVQYISNILFVFISVGLMYISVKGYSIYSYLLPWADSGQILTLITKIVVGGLVYVGTLSVFDRELFRDLRALKHSKSR